MMTGTRARLPCSLCRYNTKTYAAITLLSFLPARRSTRSLLRRPVRDFWYFAAWCLSVVLSCGRLSGDYSMSAAQLAALAQVLLDGRNTNYANVSSLCLLAFDYILTFDQEYALVWKTRWTLGKMIYLAFRYGGMGIHAFDTFVYVNTSAGLNLQGSYTRSDSRVCRGSMGGRRNISSSGLDYVFEI
ncbi:hypothetical protein SISSUDRAFT_425953 [Sistotremastrum suecicum HHB10207 ss-3]|uniref:DUF6533 domain-containing protein n=1 Tax=Sistotremastrum suecicum HHB10207 ss-3 TaxID=1314776 RepID=A0A166FKW7_9AGAM|nr:hypothetical protein SISSUDRAFT_425953 [Sistotremastrum suecicum HHB10207 ss-3]